MVETLLQADVSYGSSRRFTLSNEQDAAQLVLADSNSDEKER